MYFLINSLLVNFMFPMWSLLLQAEQTSQKRSWRLLLLLPKRGPRAFSSFCSALQDTEQTHLYDLLIKSPEKDGRETHTDVSVYLTSTIHMSHSSSINSRFSAVLRLLSAHRVFSLRRSHRRRQGSWLWKAQKRRERWACLWLSKAMSLLAFLK